MQLRLANLTSVTAVQGAAGGVCCAQAVALTVQEDLGAAGARRATACGIDLSLYESLTAAGLEQA